MTLNLIYQSVMLNNFQEVSFKLKYNGAQHQIDANVLINSLAQTTTIIQGINHHIDSGKNIQIKINALEKGSFIVGLEIIETTLNVANTLLTRDNVDIAANIVSVFINLLEIKQFLKGKDPVESIRVGDDYEVKNNKGDVTIIKGDVYNIYMHDQNIKEAISRNFDTINADESITGFEVLGKDESTLFKVNRDSFDELSVISEEIEGRDKFVTESATLFIIRPSFDPNLKWDFYYKRNKISARIKDDNFHSLINAGERFAKGDILEVDLKIHQEYDPVVKVHFNKSYLIEKIHKHKYRDELQELDFPSQDV